MTEDDWTAGMPDEPGHYLTFWSDRTRDVFYIDEVAIALGYVCVDQTVITYWQELPGDPVNLHKPPFKQSGELNMLVENIATLQAGRKEHAIALLKAEILSLQWELAGRDAMGVEVPE